MSTQIFLNNVNGSRGLFAQTDDSIPVTDLSGPGSLIGTGLGALTVPANGFVVGDSFSFVLSGHIDTPNNSDLALTIESLPTGAIFVASGPITMPQCTNQHWQLNVTFTIRKLGPPGGAIIATAGAFSFIGDPAGNKFEGYDFSTINNTTFDTTVANTLEVKASWLSTSGGESIYSEVGVLHKIY
jgi:hypothetical protein